MSVKVVFDDGTVIEEIDAVNFGYTIGKTGTMTVVLVGDDANTMTSVRRGYCRLHPRSWQQPLIYRQCRKRRNSPDFAIPPLFEKGQIRLFGDFRLFRLILK